MFFAILYIGGGIYMFLIAAGVVHKEFGEKLDPMRRLGIRLLAGGLVVLGIYYAFHAHFFSSPAGKEYRDLERRLRQETGPSRHPFAGPRQPGGPTQPDRSTQPSGPRQPGDSP